MSEQKINEVIISTPIFIATLTFPIKNKITKQVSKNKTITQEEIDAAIVISPVVHGGTIKKDLELVDEFYSLIIQDVSSGFSKNKAQKLEKFLAACPVKVKIEFMQNSDLSALQELRKKLDHAFVHLLDNSGMLVDSKIKTIEDILFWLNHIKKRINEQYYETEHQEKTSSLLIVHEPALPPKPRRQERIKKRANKKEGWHVKSHIYSSEKSQEKAA